MTDPSVDAEFKSHADRLRALEDQFSSRYGYRPDDGFDGFREYSRAWHENRVTAYLLRKSFADPVSRAFFIIVATVIVLGIAVLLYQ
ncbi:hypothetical protein HJG53_12305 [Sphingomonas sp. ID1715]|uniref:hypothetical protein n=1 Tax=Sphingomonas sp. ID1715 TaxID=1656898 RepID=UPI001489B310|nr:hypothetical protein [Sphingomonas sp. ID1715]NNM77691.1 hypothetical protein [Sphingomonas sp. ID1715]